jgi:membrane protease YdiL (CAAX protease family)
MIKSIFFAGSRIRLIWPLSIVVVLIVVGEFLIVDPFGKLLKIIGLSESPISNAQEWSPAIFEFIKRSLRSLVVILAVWAPIKYLMRKRFSFAGFVMSKGLISRLLLGISLGFVIQLVALLLMVLFGWYSVDGFLWHFKSAGAILPSLLFAFVFSAETGILEETIFRGFLMNSIADRFGSGTGVITSSIVFGLLHFSGSSAEFPWWMSLLSATIGGFLFAQAYLLFKSIWVPLGLHFAWHFAARTLGTPGVSPEEACFLVTNVDGPTLLVGTKFGGASIFELIGVGVCSLVIYLISKKRNSKHLDC